MIDRRAPSGDADGFNMEMDLRHIRQTALIFVSAVILLMWLT